MSFKPSWHIKKLHQKLPPKSKSKGKAKNKAKGKKLKYTTIDAAWKQLRNPRQTTAERNSLGIVSQIHNWNLAIALTVLEQG
jgi:hypothetical protein